MVRGWWRFVKEQKGKLELATTVHASREYREAQDVVAQFIAEYCIEHGDESVKYSDFKRDFRRFLMYEHIHEQYSDKRISAALAERGYTSLRSNGIWYKGVGLIMGKHVPMDLEVG
jgi:hypothetical protein